MAKYTGNAFRDGFIGAFKLAWALVKEPIVAVIRVMNEHVKGNNMQTTFGELKIGDTFYDNCGSPATKVSWDKAQYEDSDGVSYFFSADEKVDKA